MSGWLSDAEQQRARLLLRANARDAASASLSAAAEFIFSLPPAAHHDLWIEALEAVERGEITRLLLIAPPGHAKSTIASIVFPTWYIGRHPAHHLIGVTTTATLGALYGDATRSMIEESTEFHETFPQVRPNRRRGWSSEGFFVTRPWKAGDKDPTMVYTGAGGPIIGRRAEGLIIDDAVDREIARSVEVMLPERLRWLRQSALSRLSPRGWAVCIGTLWTEGDVVDTFEKSGEWVTIRMKALSTSRLVTADVTIPDGVDWRPSRFTVAGQ